MANWIDICWILVKNGEEIKCITKEFWFHLVFWHNTKQTGLPAKQAGKEHIKVEAVLWFGAIFFTLIFVRHCQWLTDFHRALI